MCSRQLIDGTGHVKILPETRATVPEEPNGTMSMSPRTLLFTSAIIVLLGNAAAARDDRGFRMGGGVGAVSCPDFLNAMATARKKGGLTSVAGLREIAPYQYYISGFQTGYNSEADGVYDIFESLGNDDASDRVLSELELWCASHPDQTFAIALLAIAQSLRDKLIGP